MSNFEYLMALNSFGGRSYDDLMQYPVFPWVLSQYYTSSLALREECFFRDLHRPMV